MSKPLTIKRILGPSWSGESLTNTHAINPLSELLTWAAQCQHQDPAALLGGLEDLALLFTFSGHEIEITLALLRLIQPSDAHGDLDHLATAIHYLQRWQDQGGRIGSAA